MNIRPCTVDDLPAICAIYNHYVEHTVITFEEQQLAVEEMSRRVAACTAHYPWLVSTHDGVVAGYAYATRWKERAAYRHSAELSVYIRQDLQGRGHGRALYRELCAELEARGCHVLIGGIALPNDASVRLHESAGFTRVAHFPEVGKKFGRWVDVGYWQLTLAR